jgi:hypothetical protein
LINDLICIHHTDRERESIGCPVCANQATEKLTKENEILKSKLQIACTTDSVRIAWAFSEAENQTLTTRIKSLEAEVERLKCSELDDEQPKHNDD